ncbi:metallophosphoesterase [Mucilaginibacter ginkgonis]|uniref:Metallophosphoesterase n=1 Tax=Mucilaginibacter ginkgonis TaxID=2682091 RepID=A0A6I4INC5_9SPHI|nr:metallophosphoesterase [Mucilaginibacter ginkgonis]QQL49280.1 metallophosphoesterase [Mucilaginibacter ginkgonis]
MRRFLQRLLTKPVIRLSNKLSSRPKKQLVFKALTRLYKGIITATDKKGKIIPFDPQKDKFIILSDQHKGARDFADDFALAEKNYLAALEYYYKQGFYYINLGDSEELWENLLLTVLKHNKETFEAEKKFLTKNAFTKIFGNHDLYWDNDPLAPVTLKNVYGEDVKINEGLVLRTQLKDRPLDIFMTHGHQGDLQSDGNWFSKWFVSNIWGPVQAYLRINPNTPANNDDLKTTHNVLMYEWSGKQDDTLLITGHTHQPVFASLTHIESLYLQRDKAKAANDETKLKSLDEQISRRHLKGDTAINFKGYKPTYFNSGCCCFDDGDITGIEIADGCIRLIKWEYAKGKQSKRKVLDERTLEQISAEINSEISRPAKTQKPL